MGTITSGVGLISGINIQDVVKQLISIEARPLDLLKQRIQDQTQIKAAYGALVAQFVLARSNATALSTPSTFEARTAKSSNENVLTATATSSAPVNDYTFQVASLVATHQVVSTGFASRG